MGLKIKICLVYVILQLSACGSSGPSRSEDNDDLSAKHDAPEETMTFLQLGRLRTDLLEQYDEWRGTPSRLRGLDKRGIDCSGFVHVTFQSKLGSSLPRTTELQAQLGGTISKGNLQTGDLVFFRIDSNTRHVGIFIEGNQFLHASKSRGVMISDLTNPYWRSRYWKSKRLSLRNR